MSIFIMVSPETGININALQNFDYDETNQNVVLTYIGNANVTIYPDPDKALWNFIVRVLGDKLQIFSE